jgi:hypothetical protein
MMKTNEREPAGKRRRISVGLGKRELMESNHLSIQEETK